MSPLTNTLASFPTASRSLASARLRVAAQDADQDQRAARGMETMFFKEFVQVASAMGTNDAMPGASVLTDIIADTLAELLADNASLGVSDAIGLGRATPSHTARPRTAAEMAPTPTGIVESDHARITSRFGHRHDPFTGETRFHGGIDIAAEAGAPVHAVESGRVTFAGERGGYGNMVEVEHPDGRRSRYAHLSQISVIAGDEIAAGADLGAVGATGRATGAHLHFEMRNDDRPQDPTSALRKFRSRSDTPYVQSFSAGAPEGGQR